MPYRRTHRTRPVGGHSTVRTTRTKPTLMERLTGRRTHATTTTTRTTHTSHPRHHHHTHATTVAPVHHHKRRPGLGDKISGALMRIKGTLTRRPGLKAAGTRRQRGTDGRGSHRHY